MTPLFVCPSFYFLCCVYESFPPPYRLRCTYTVSFFVLLVGSTLSFFHTLFFYRHPRLSNRAFLCRLPANRSLVRTQFTRMIELKFRIPPVLAVLFLSFAVILRIAQF